MSRRVIGGIAAIVLTLGACGSSAPTIEGLVVAVDGDLTTVQTFDVRIGSGEVLRFQPDPVGRFEFPLPHLSNHMASLDPVRVTYRTEGGETLIAIGVSDA